ncbi:zinc ribbon domain-containing protein [Halovenus rubra]|uniref:Zinc ribbon domain-containing protein n=2 Tax=Halovenus rubra TaxID=869890 RepID=A0ABD5X4I6_9EURY|nr:zinc ribbon domain-containing protein [Halovenus rubra]
MNYCPECGESVSKNDVFCANCGTQIRQKPRSENRARKRIGRSDGSGSAGAESTEAEYFRLLGVISTGMAIVGVFMNWIQFEFVSVLNQSVSTTAIGLDFNLGLAVSILAVVSCLCLIAGESSLYLFAGLLGLGITAGMVALLIDPFMFQPNLDDFEVAALSEVSEIGTGVYVTLCGGVGVTLFGFLSAVAVSK